MTMPIFNGKSVPPDVIAALHDGRLIEAIKCWRAFSGEDLYASKLFIEAIRPQVLGTTEPPRTAARPSPSPELPKHELLLKLLKMTASQNDAEALVAIRKANALLATAGWDWDRLLAGKITVVGDPFGNLQRPSPPSADSYAPMPTSPRAPPRAQAKPAPQYQYTQAPRQQGKRAKVSYDDIFSDAQAFGRTS